MHSLFGNAAAVATGVAAALRVKGRSDVRVVAQGGDGGTTDIGFGCLSGMFERNDDVLYICYDNEAYMNTGVQRSVGHAAGGAHRHHAGGRRPSRATCSARARTLPLIAMAHEIPYVATATVADLRDLEAKVERRWSIRGARYIQSRALPAGLGHRPPATPSSIARLAKETGLFPVFEAEHGEVTGVSKIRRQRAGRGLSAAAEALRAPVLARRRAPTSSRRIQALADRNIRRFGLLDDDREATT